MFTSFGARRFRMHHRFVNRLFLVCCFLFFVLFAKFTEEFQFHTLKENFQLERRLILLSFFAEKAIGQKRRNENEREREKKKGESNNEMAVQTYTHFDLWHLCTSAAQRELKDSQRKKGAENT